MLTTRPLEQPRNCCCYNSAYFMYAVVEGSIWSWHLNLVGQWCALLFWWIMTLGFLVTCFLLCGWSLLYPIEFCDPYSRNVLLFWSWMCPTFLCCIRELGSTTKCHIYQIYIRKLTMSNVIVVNKPAVVTFIYLLPSFWIGKTAYN
jgi:hypothetical protein